jgi:hypothetical protein
MKWCLGLFSCSLSALHQISRNTAYPNPSDQYVTIAYTFLHAKEESTLHIFDNLGRQIDMRNLGEVFEGQQLIDTRTHSNGVYIYEIVQEGERVLSGKFIVNH